MGTECSKCLDNDSKRQKKGSVSSKKGTKNDLKFIRGYFECWSLALP